MNDALTEQRSFLKIICSYYLQSNNNGQQLLWKNSWMVELTENEMLVFKKVVHINRTINNAIKWQNSQQCFNLLTQKCICGTTVTAHVAENKRRRAWQNFFIFYFGDCLNICHFYSKSLVIYNILQLLELSDYLQMC